MGRKPTVEFQKHHWMRRENRERDNSCKLSVTSLVGGWAINRMEQQCKSCFVNVDVVLVASKLDLHVNVMVDPPLSPDPLPLPLPPLHRTLKRATEEHAASLSPTSQFVGISEVLLIFHTVQVTVLHLLVIMKAFPDIDNPTIRRFH